MGGRGDTHCVSSGDVYHISDKNIIPLLLEGVPEGRGSHKEHKNKNKKTT